MDETSSAVVETPSSSAPTPSAAPASTSTPEPQATTDRPSFGEALDTFNSIRIKEGKKPRGVKPGTATPVAATAETPTTEATTEGQTPPPAPKGPIPFEVHDQALKNARAKERQAVEQEYRLTYGDPQVAREAVQWFQSAARDRVGFLAQVINEALADPELAPQIASLAGRTLGGNRSPQPAPADEPQPDFTDGQGNAFYSAKQQRAHDEWLINRVKTEVLGEVQPGLQTVEHMRAEQEQARQSAQLTQTFAGYLTEARTEWEGFKEHEAEIKQALLDAPLTSGHPADERILLERTYRRIVGPKLSQLQQQKWLADLKARAGASSLNPAATGAPVGVPKNVRAKDGGTFANALKWAAEQNAGR